MAISRKLNAPLLIPVLAWTAGILLGKHLPWGYGYGALALAVGLVGLIFPKLRGHAVIILFILLGAFRLQLEPGTDTPLRQALRAKDSIQQELVFRVKTSFSSSNRAYGVLSDSLAGHALKADIIYYSERELQPGRYYRGLAELRALQHDPILDVYPHRYEARAYQKGGLTESQGSNPSLWVDGLRHALLENLDAKLGSEAGWAKALLFSDTEVKNEYRSVLQQSGMLHLIVVSGLHVWFIYLVVLSVLRIFLARRHAEIIFLPLILLFAALNNWAPSITRSILMIGTIILAHWLERPLSGGQNLALSLFIITLIQPLQLFTLGLQLSYLSVAILVFALPKVELFPSRGAVLKVWKTRANQLIHGILVSALISLAISPLTLYHFGTASLNGIIGNLIGIPLSSLLLPLATLILMLPQSSFICRALINSYLGIIWLWKQWIIFAASLPLSVNGHYFNGYRALAMAIAMVMLLILIRARFRLAIRLAIPSLALILALFLMPQAQSSGPDVSIFAAGVADCSLIRLPNGQNLMIDTGGISGNMYEERAATLQSMQTNSWAQQKLIPWLERHGITRIDHLLLSHMHSDHSGGLLSLLGNCEVGEIIIAQGIQNTPLWKEIAATSSFHPEKVIVITDTCSFYYGAAKLQILHPGKGFRLQDENERSLVCRLDLNGKKLLFTGDIGLPAEEYLAEHHPQDLRCDYLKVPHHGSRNSSSEIFLRACQPREAWLCLQSHNRFGFPHSETVARYRKQQIRLRSTGEGSIKQEL